MSIQSEISRISGNVSDALDAIEAKGVTIPTGANSDDLAALIAQIQSGGMTVVETPDTHGGTIVTISGDSVTLQAKSVMPSESAQDIRPDQGYTGLSSVAVGAIDSEYIGSGITQRSSSDLTASGATVSVPSGYYAESASKAVASGTAGTPTAIKGTVSNHSISVTPSVTNTAGYISGGTKTGTAVSVSASELVSGNKAITENGANIDVTNYATVSVDVPTDGGSAKNMQVYMGADYARATSYTATDVSLTVAKTGTYTVSWIGWRSTSSGTSGSQLYIDGQAYGSAHTTFTGTYGQTVTLNNVSLTAGDVLVVRARARSTSYYMYVGNLIIEEV